MLKLKLQYFGHLMPRADSLEKTPMLGKIGGRRRRARQRMGRLDGITDSMGMSLSELRELAMDREAWRVAVYGVAKSRTRLSDWTMTWYSRLCLCFRAGAPQEGPPVSSNPGLHCTDGWEPATCESSHHGNPPALNSGLDSSSCQLARLNDSRGGQI